jgi:hypothetical protein
MFLKPLLYLQFYPHEVHSYSLVEEKVGAYAVLKLRPTVSLYIYFKVKKGRLKKDRRTKVINPLFFTMG